jgi:hypothetical protein
VTALSLPILSLISKEAQVVARVVQALPVIMDLVPEAETEETIEVLTRAEMAGVVPDKE